MAESGARRRSIARPLLATAWAILALVALGTPAITPGVDASSRWTGGIDLYRASAFSTQQTLLWCTAADVQIIRNIVDRASDHTRTNQQRYFDYMRAHDRYRIPVSDGTEPSGWAAGLRHFVDGRYRMVPSTSFDAALRSAVTNLRRTNLPVGLLVAHGDHAWVLTGFTATADPARTSRFTVTSVRVVGPLWGIQNRSYGYDMAPDTRLTPAQLRGFFTPWHYARIRMAWEGRWVSIQAIPAVRTTQTTATPAVRTTQATATLEPHVNATSRSTASAATTAAGTPGPATTSTPLVGAAVAGPSDPATAVAALAVPAVAETEPAGWLGFAALLVVGAGAGLVLARSLRRGPR